VQRSYLVLFGTLFVAVWLCDCQKAKPRASGPPPAVPVTIGMASVQTVPNEIRVVGSVEPSSKVEIKSQVAGQLFSVHFTEGQDVKQGDLLFEIDPQPYRETLRQAEAALERDKASLNQSMAALEKDRLQSKMADEDAKRFETLAREKIVSSQQNLQYRTTAEVALESMRSDQAAIESARAGLKVDEAAVARAKLDLSYCEIRAPISGRTGNLLVHAGNLVKVNDVALVVINRVSPVFVSFNAPERNLEAIRRASTGHRLAVDVTSRDDPGTKSTGYLSVVDNTVDTQTGTIHLKATFENANRLLWPGQFVNVALVLGTQNATVIPSEAVQAGQRGQFVYVVKPDRSVEARVVSVGRTVDRRVIIDKGVNAGETVVTDGQMLLFPGAHVMVASAPKGEAPGQ
jgi:multidrug efflux system membrane fusion protein